MNAARRVAWLIVSLGLAFGAAQAQAQVPNSDSLFELITDQNGAAVNDPQLFTVAEGVEGPVTFTVPALTVFFREGLNGPISDAFHFDAFNVTITSDNNPGGMPARTGAITVSAAALERFEIFGFRAVSDGNPSPTNSDSLTSRLFGFQDFTTPLVEPVAANQSETASVAFLSQRYDVVGDNGLISDYVDLGPVSAFFLSSDNQGDYAGLTGNGTVTEDLVNGGTLNYSLMFQSDVNESVPEPASIVLLCTGLVPVGLIAIRRSAWRRNRQASP
jgi:hypothetical protein